MEWKIERAVLILHFQAVMSARSAVSSQVQVLGTGPAHHSPVSPDLTGLPVLEVSVNM